MAERFARHGTLENQKRKLHRELYLLMKLIAIRLEILYKYKVCMFKKLKDIKIFFCTQK